MQIYVDHLLGTFQTMPSRFIVRRRILVHHIHLVPFGSRLLVGRWHLFGSRCAKSKRPSFHHAIVDLRRLRLAHRRLVRLCCIKTAQLPFITRHDCRPCPSLHSSAHCRFRRRSIFSIGTKRLD